MTTDIAVKDTEQPPASLAIAPTQTTFTPTQRAALAQLGIDDASDGDIDVFFHQCRKTGLDPFAKQIYMIGRRTSVKEWNPSTRKQDTKWVMKYTIQIGIDGYRLSGRRAAERIGVPIRKEGPFWQGLDGSGWSDVWLHPNNPPAAAKVTIFRDGEPFTGTAMYWEYAQGFQGDDGTFKPNSMWAKMPANQLAKCAEAAAWRQAFPDDFSGVVSEDGVQIIDSDSAPTGPVKRQGPRGSDGLGAALGVVKTSPQEPTQPEPEPTDATLATKAQIKHLSDLLDRERCTTPESKRQWIEGQTGKTDPRTLGRSEAGDLIQFLEQAQAADAAKTAPAATPEPVEDQLPIADVD